MADDQAPPPAGRDYRPTVFLPQTSFPMRAGLPKLEPEILARWAQMDLYAALRAQRQAEGAPLYVLHDGPPYANGAIHIGHVLQKTLKDFVVRSRFALGYDVDYVPGWDCHGLPIEWKVEEELRAKGRRKDEVSPVEFRERCRAYASGWIDVQMAGFRRLGVLGDWAHRYATMDFASEAAIVAEFHKFLMSGQLYRGSKPVMWSPVERTALADAEVEYHDHVSPTIWVRFPVQGGEGATAGAGVVIWTTTPWTIPANRAISFGPDIAYGLYRVEAVAEGLEFQPWAKAGDRLILADKLAGAVFAAAKITAWTRLDGVDPTGLVCEHPLARLTPRFGYAVPLLPGDHVTDDAGTGFVHTAPGHGQEDYQVWRDHAADLERLGIDTAIPDTVDPDGRYYPSVPLFGGLAILETEGKKAGKFGPANGAVMERLIEAGHLLARGRLEHSYPHSWRSKAPVIFRNTPQWFIRMDADLGDGTTLRSRALSAIDATAFFPEQGRNRIRAMVQARPDWLISRQRAWGTPLAMFVDRRTGEPLRDAEVNARILAAMREHGADAWFTTPSTVFLGPGRDPADYEKVEDILDVWFDSGSTHAFTLEGRPHTRWPADLYLEGSDQHRGWFQSSLLEACGSRGRAPYDALLTHGFTVDEKGEKMSKSLGNALDPDMVIKESGAEILRLWVAMSDYTEDQRIGKTILQTATDGYRKLRNTLRYLLGALDGFEAAERVAPEDMPRLERAVLHMLALYDAEVRQAYAEFRFRDVWRALSTFSSVALSAFYFDVRKDALYCDDPASLRRRACRTVMDLVFERLTIWLSPLLPFTTEEAWTTRFPQAGSNCARTFPETPAAWRGVDDLVWWARVEEVTAVVTGALEQARRDKRIGAALEAAPQVFVADPELAAAFRDIDPAEAFRTSAAEIVEGEPPRTPSAWPRRRGWAWSSGRRRAASASAAGASCRR